MNRRDPYNLERFVQAQAGVYSTALAELRNGRKRTHWMWFIFPQFVGLGSSPTSQHYAIKSVEEARAYLSHPLLGARLSECTRALLDVERRSASEIFGYPDDLKLKSSMTLFEQASASQGEKTANSSLFGRVLDSYYDGERDAQTLRLLGTSA